MIMKTTIRERLFAAALVALIGALILNRVQAHAAAPTTSGAPYDPCAYQPMNFVPMAVATAAGPTLLIPAIAGEEIHVCHIEGTIPSSSAIQFSQGITTGLVPMTGAYTSIIGEPLMTLLRAAVNNNVYLTTTGTGVQGWVDFVYEVPPFNYATTTAFATSTPTQTPTPTATPTPTPTKTPTPTPT